MLCQQPQELGWGRSGNIAWDLSMCGPVWGGGPETLPGCFPPSALPFAKAFLPDLSDWGWRGRLRGPLPAPSVGAI